VRGGARSLVLAAVLSIGALAFPRDVSAQEMILFIEFAADNPRPAPPAGPIDNLRDLSAAFRRCFQPPPVDNAVGPVDLTFKVSFKRSGDLFGKPKVVTFVQKVTPELRERYWRAVAEAIDLCSPMPFSESMGASAAGRVFRVNFLDRRNSKRAETPWPTTKTS
jgi:hypothetical protein